VGDGRRRGNGEQRERCEDKYGWNRRISNLLRVARTGPYRRVKPGM
jgi:hypothetical protein